MNADRGVELSQFSQAINAEIKARMEADSTLVQTKIAAAIGKTQAYVSHHLSERYPWTANDIDLIARLSGETGFTLVAAAKKRLAKSDGGSADVLEYLRKAPLDSKRLAATKKQTPIDPSRGEA